MTQSKKRGRGRPHGTGLNDGPTLIKMANLMVRDPVLRPTTAAKQVLKSPDEATLRRLQAKWRAAGQQYLDQARAQREAGTPRPSSTGTPNRILQQIERAQQIAGMAFGGTAIGRMQDVMNDPTLQALRAAQDNPTMRKIQEIYDRPEVRLMRELYNSPAMRLSREMDKLRRFGRE